VVRRNDPWREIDGALVQSVERSGWAAYLSEIEREAKRAWRMYGMRLLPGLELTFNDVEPDKAAHAVAVGLRTFVSVENGIADAMKTAAEAGAAVIAAHPYDGSEPGSKNLRLTRRFERDRGLRGLAHRFELFNRSELVGWVAEAELPAIACGDFHRPEHLTGWRTLIPCEREEEAISYLRSAQPVYLARFEAEISRLVA
jgi:hypothetical protein